MRDFAEFSDGFWFLVNKIKDVCRILGLFEVLISWRGLIAARDRWEPPTWMFEDKLSKLRNLFKRCGSTVASRDAKHSIVL